MRVGICIPVSERGPERRTCSYSDMRELAVLTEQSGLDSIWLADHLLFKNPGREPSGAWESLSMLAALAETTSKVELGPLVLCSPFRNAGLIAWMANTLDEISGGRFVLGLGSGWHEPEFTAFGFEFERRVSLFEDQLEVMAPLLRDGSVDYDGSMAVGHATLRPPRVRQSGPPIMIACSRPRMMGLTARWADRWNSVWYGLPTDEFRAERDLLHESCWKIGRDPASIEVTVGLVIADAENIAGNWPQGIPDRVEDVAAALAVWHDQGVAEVMFRMEAPSPAAIEKVAHAAEALRAPWSGVRD